MIKRIIFDIDNTLIKWEDSYYEKLGKVFERLQMSYTQTDITNVVNAIAEYEERECYFRKQAMFHILEEKLQKKLPSNFVEVMLDYFATCVPARLPQETIDTLEYLSRKYELVTLSNWFEETQQIRLEKVGIKKYFKEIYTCESIKIKPNRESYQVAAGKYKAEECLMIGDSIKNDIEGAQKCNMQVLYYNPKKLPTNYPCIQTMSELKNIL